MHINGVLAPEVIAHLPQRFQKGQALDIPDGAAHFYNDYLSACCAGNQLDVAFDFVGDVRDDLNGAAEVIATALGCNDVGVKLAGGYVADLLQVDVDEALIVAKV